MKAIIEVLLVVLVVVVAIVGLIKLWNREVFEGLVIIMLCLILATIKKNEME